MSSDQDQMVCYEILKSVSAGTKGVEQGVTVLKDGVMQSQADAPDMYKLAESLPDKGSWEICVRDHK